MDWKLAFDRSLKILTFLVLLMFMFQLGQYNAHLAEQTIKDYCPVNVNSSVSWTGEMALWTNPLANNLNNSHFNYTVNGT